jgi:DNA METHYLASE-TYPE I RESTRICTION-MODIFICATION SYSTEM
LTDGLEISEIKFSKLDLKDRYDSEFFIKDYLSVEEKLNNLFTKNLGSLATAVASAFYPAATQLYGIGDTAFVRCVDCIDYPIISTEQDSKFEKIPLDFAKSNKGISFIKSREIVITKVGTPCYASIVYDYNELALSRTVLGLTNIHDIDPYYLMVFLRSNYGFKQLFRQRELTIQYQLTLPRVKAIKIYIPSREFQRSIKELCICYLEINKQAENVYKQAENALYEYLGNFTETELSSCAVKSLSQSFKQSGRLDAEYYLPKYDALFETLSKFTTANLGEIVSIKKSIEPGSEAYQDEGIPFVRVSDVNKFGISEPSIRLSSAIVSDIESLYPRKNTILLSKDGSIGIAYKVEEDMQVVTSGALLHLTVKDTSQILPDYLTLALNSQIVQLQAERDCNGAIIQHWKPSDIEKVRIPVLNTDKQKEISDKVQESFRLRKEAKRLLEKAIKAVETAIETDEETALKLFAL